VVEKHPRSLLIEGHGFTREGNGIQVPTAANIRQDVLLSGIFQTPVFDFLVQIKIHAEMLAAAHPADCQFIQRNLLALHLLRENLSGRVDLQERRCNEISHHGGKKNGHNAARGEKGKKTLFSGGSAKRGQKKVCCSHQSDDGAHAGHNGGVSVRKMWCKKLNVN